MPTLDTLATALRSRLIRLKGLRSLAEIARQTGVSRTTLDAFLRLNEPVSRLTMERLEAWANQEEAR